MSDDFTLGAEVPPKREAISPCTGRTAKSCARAGCVEHKQTAQIGEERGGGGRAEAMSATSRAAATPNRADSSTAPRETVAEAKCRAALSAPAKEGGAK